MEAEYGGPQPQSRRACSCQKLQEPERLWDNLILDFWAPELGENTFV